jgi:hypothetical protein
MAFEEGMLVVILPSSSTIRIVGTPVEAFPYKIGIIEKKDKHSEKRWDVRVEGEKHPWHLHENNMKPLLPFPLPPDSQKLSPKEAFQKHLTEIICALAFST